MASVTISQLYAALRSKGYSDAGAKGIIANAVYESGPATSAVTGSSTLDLGATGDAGCSHGLLQWNTCGGGYKSMAGASLTQNVAYITQTVPSSCTRLGTASAVAGCIAQNFERCQGCQPGGAQYNARTAVAGVLAKLNLGGGSSGTGSGAAAGSGAGTGTGSTRTGTPAGGAIPAAQTTAQTSPAPSSCACAWSWNLAIIHGCFVNKCQLRQVIGAGVLVAGAVISLAGLFLIMRGTAAGTAVGRAGSAGIDAMAGGLAIFQPEVGIPLAAERAATAPARHARRADAAAARTARRASTRAQMSTAT
jgi:hypothetical protein